MASLSKGLAGGFGVQLRSSFSARATASSPRR
jgi:hypothetical protein